MKSAYRIVAIIIFLLNEHLVAVDGTLDTTFNPTGPVPGIVLSSGPDVGSFASSVIIQADGKIINLLPGNPAMLVVRLNTIGQFDTSFGTGGIVNLGIPSMGPFSLPSVSDSLFFIFYDALALQPDGKILAAVGVSDSGFYLKRLMPDGAFDTEFVSDAVDYPICALAVQPDNKIIAISIRISQADTGSKIYRFNKNGLRDISFGNQGCVTCPDYTQPISIAVQPDGKILTAGTTYSFNQCDSFYLLRLLSDGSYDTSFGTNGEAIMLIPNKPHAIIASIIVLSDGTILAGGWGGDNDGTNNNFVLAQYTTDGHLDTTFGGGQGYVVNVDGAAIKSLAVQSDGKIVAAGYREGDSAFVIARYLPDGSLDTTGFGTNGVVTTTDLGIIVADSAAIQPDGNIVVSGSYNPDNGGGALARYTVANTPLVSTTITYPPSGQTFDVVPTFSGAAQNPSMMSIFINDTLNDVDTVFTTSSYNQWSLTPTRSHARSGIFPPGTYTYRGVSYYPNGRSQQETQEGTFTIESINPHEPLSKMSLLSEKLLSKGCSATYPATSDLAVALHNKVCDVSAE